MVHSKLTQFLDLPVQYEQMSEKIEWLINELNKKKTFSPSEFNWTKSTDETFSVFKMVKGCNKEFGSRICHSYVIYRVIVHLDLFEVLLLAKEMGFIDQNSEFSL